MNLYKYKIARILDKDDTEGYWFRHESSQGFIFHKFDTTREAWDYILEAEERCFHEIIRVDEQKLRFDIDCSDDIDKADMREYIKALVDECLEILGKSTILVFSSNGDQKLSYHIIIDCMVSCKEKAKQFTINVLSAVEHEFNKYVDLGVYKRNQSFRTYGSYKRGTERYKKFVPSLSTDCPTDQYKIFKLSLLSHRGRNTADYDLELSIIPNGVLGKIDGAIDAHINEAICKSEGTEELAYIYSSPPSQNIGKATHYKRIAPSYCSYCERTHENDNIAILLRDNGKCYVKCFRFDKYIFLTYVNSHVPKKAKKEIAPTVSNPSMRNERLKILTSLEPVVVERKGRELYNIMTSA